MRGFSVVIVLVVAVTAYFWPKRTPRVERVDVEAPAASVAKVSPVVPAAPRVEASPAAEQKPAVDPYTVDRFSLRELKKPRPTSVAELLAKRTPYADPMLPAVLPGQERDGDGDVLTHYFGYFESAAGELRPIDLLRDTNGVTLQMIERRWLDGEVKKANFAGDPYSLILETPNHSVVYLKFSSRAERPDLGRTMIGWIVAGRKVMRVVLVEDKAPEKDAVGALLPPALPAD